VRSFWILLGLSGSLGDEHLSPSAFFFLFFRHTSSYTSLFTVSSAFGTLTMYLPPLLVLAGAAATAFSAVVSSHDDSLGNLMRRQTNASSVCSTSGVNYQDGGDYFINTNSNQAFLIVSTFQGCNNDTADVSLVNESTGDQYDCGSVLTVPNGVPQTATCPILKSQFTSGTFLIITVGNNGNGQPFAYQRQITIRAGTQQTITRYNTATTTITPTVTVNCKSE
jgi:hypothetical protein